jgi:hypothetical protein
VCVEQLRRTEYLHASATLRLGVISKSAALIMFPQHHDGVARVSLADWLGAQLDEVEQDRDQDNWEHVATRKGDTSRDEDSLQAGHYCEKL